MGSKRGAVKGHTNHLSVQEKGTIHFEFTSNVKEQWWVTFECGLCNESKFECNNKLTHKQSEVFSIKEYTNLEHSICRNSQWEGVKPKLEALFENNKNKGIMLLLLDKDHHRSIKKMIGIYMPHSRNGQ